MSKLISSRTAKGTWDCLNSSFEFDSFLEAVSLPLTWENHTIHSILERKIIFFLTDLLFLQFNLKKCFIYRI